MKRKYKFFNGEIAEFETMEEYKALVKKDFELMDKQREEEKKKLESTIEKIKQYVNTTLKEKYSYEIGLVLTNIDKDIKKYNAFMIWIDKGYAINHKFIHLKDIRINF